MFEALEHRAPVEHHAFVQAISALQAQAANAGAHLQLDAATRRAYSRNIAAMADELTQRVHAGTLTWRQAAEQANAVRNEILAAMRGRSTPVGRALAEQLKARGRSLNELVAKKAIQLFGDGTRFDLLSQAQREQVYAEVVTASGRSNPGVNASLARWSVAGRVLILASVAMSVYIVATADDPWRAAGQQAVMAAGGIAGGVAGGALAGLACGPGAPVCVTIGAFVGGVVAAAGLSALW